MDWRTIVEPKDLAAELGRRDLVVVDCRFSLADSDDGRRRYLDSHIPDARYAHLDNDLSGSVVPGITGRHPLPDLDTLAATFSAWGISKSVQVVAYDAASGGIAGRLWWLLRWLGHERIALLNGGWPSWIDAEFPVSAEIPSVKPAKFDVAVATETLYSTADVEKIASDPQWLLVDSRAASRYRGEEEPLDPVAGHIPGAVSAPWKDNLDESGRFLNPDILRERFEGLIGDVDPENVVFHCGSGVTAIHNIISMRHAGLGNAGLYAGSWSEWIVDRRRPVATGEE